MQQQLTPEQAQALQERIKNMSPEELKEFQKQQCIFCKIIKGEVASKKIYEDKICMAILDINPANPGHILLLPKEHYAIMPLIPEDELGHMAMAAKALSHVLLNTLKAEGTNIFIANGTVAGQRAQHFMLHLIPRKENDEIGLELHEKNISKQKLNEIKEKIISKLGSASSASGSKKSSVELKKEPEKIQEAEFEEIKEQEKEEQFITSQTAKRYHRKNCAFAQNISKEKRLYITQEEADASERLPCTCVTGKRIPLKKADNPIAEKRAEKKPAEQKSQKKKTSEKSASSKKSPKAQNKKPKTKEPEVSLDEIASLMK